jgi:hypothetical protein
VSTSPPVPPAPLTLSALLRETSRELQRGLGGKLAIVLLTIMPAFLLVRLLAAQLRHFVPFAWNRPTYFVMPWVYSVILSLAWNTSAGAIAWRVFHAARGDEASVMDALRATLRRLGPLFATGLLVLVAMLGGTLLLLVPGIAACALLNLAVPVCVIESRTPLDALRRSADLTRGVRRTAVALAVACLAVLLGGAMAINHWVAGSTRAHVTVSLLWSVTTTLLLDVLIATSYRMLRARRGEDDVLKMAAVFE